MKHSVPTRRATDLSLADRHPCAVAPERHRSSSPCERTYRPFAVPTGYCAPARRPYGQNRPENHIGRTPRYKPSCSVQDVPFPNHGPEGPVPSGESSGPSVFPVFLIGLFVGVTSLTHQLLLQFYMLTCGVVRQVERRVGKECVC